MYLYLYLFPVDLIREPREFQLFTFGVNGRRELGPGVPPGRPSVG